MRDQPKAVTASKAQSPSECSIEVLKDLRRNRIHHLLMKLRIMLQWLAPVSHGYSFVVKIYCPKVTTSRGVIVNYFKSIIAKVSFISFYRPVRYLDGDTMIASPRHHGVKCKDSQR